MISRIILILLIGASVTAIRAQESDCYETEYHHRCYTAAKSIFDDYIYLKSRPFTWEMQHMKFEVNLSRNTLYLFNICEGDKAGVKIKIYDTQDESAPIASTYDESSGRHNRILSVYPKHSGKYAIQVIFSDDSPKCAVLVLGMIRKNIETYITIPKE